MPADDLDDESQRARGADAPDPDADGSAAEPGATTDPGGPDEPLAESKGKKHRFGPWQEAGILLVAAVVVALVVKTLFIQAFYIPSESMEPGLQVNDRIIVEKPSYWLGSPQRGDIVVFDDPGGWLPEGEAASQIGPVQSALSKVGLFPTGGHLVKRVIGVAGDTIVCCDDEGRLSVNGTTLVEGRYARHDRGQCFGPMTGTCDWTAGPVPEGSIFVMGDNRSHSGDSSAQLCTDVETDCVPGREFVGTDLVVGKVVAVVWPYDNLRRLGRPAVLADVPDAP